MATTKAPTVADLKAMTDAELEVLQLAVSAEVAVRIQNQRLKDRLVTVLTDAQGVGFTDAEIDAVFKESKDHAHKGRKDPAADVPMPNLNPSKKLAKGLSEKTTALINTRAKISTAKKAT